MSILPRPLPASRAIDSAESIARYYPRPYPRRPVALAGRRFGSAEAARAWADAAGDAAAAELARPGARIRAAEGGAR